jgi:putative oxidoreductase
MFNFNFDLTDGWVLLRLVVGLFLIPHALGKLKNQVAVQGFFEVAGMRPTKAWLWAAMIIEWVLVVCLVLDIATQIAAWFTFVFMLVAAAANYKVCKGKWLWNIGGSEYPVFWGLCAAILAMNVPPVF